MDPQPSQVFIEECRNAFGFLVRVLNVYEFNQSGERVRTDIMSIMGDRRVSDLVLNQRGIPMDDRVFYRLFLNHYAFLLKNYGKDILADNPNGF